MFNEKQINNKIIEWFLIPSNISVAIVAAIFWLILFLPYNANHNFDMISTILNNIIHFSSVCFAAALISKNADVGAAAAISVLSSLLAIVMVKSLELGSLGFFIILPIALLRFLLVIKYICLAIMVHKK